MGRARILGARAARPLGGSWQIAPLPPGRAKTPGDLDTAQPEWIDCEGPLPAAAALRAADRWTVDVERDFDADDWWYRCRFAATAGEPVRLAFDGLATIADVWLNGAHVLHSDSMFVSHAVGVPDGLRADNELVMRCHALGPLLEAESRRPRARWRTGLVSHNALRWYRTSLLGRMPAWCPAVAPVGPWRPITIESSPLEVESSIVHAAIDGTAGIVRIDLRASCRAMGEPRAAKVELGGTAIVGDSSARLTCARTSDDGYSLTASVRVPHPEYWWPHTHGAQPLYEVRVLVEGDITETIDLGRVGFRTIAADCGVDGRGFGLTINGVPVFCRGVCWTPLDLPSLSADSDAYETALRQLRDAGMNMVRVGGTMAYEIDRFHDLCDELGILVWQDFMLANMDYPWEDAAFADLSLVEIRQTLHALHSRPSLVVFCGNSEVSQQAAMMGLPDAERSSRAMEATLGDLVSAFAPGQIWIPTTPDGGRFPFHTDSGITHYYGVGAYRRPLDDARRSRVRFAAECLAFSNVPEPTSVATLCGPDGRLGSTWKARIPRDGGADWDFEDVRDHYVDQLFGIRAADLRERDDERYLALGRIATGEAMLRTFAEWRRPGSPCRGALVWLARDLWPGAGWGIIDADGRPKSAYWYLKRALAPVALLGIDEGLNGLWLHAVNDTGTPIDAMLRVAVYSNGILREARDHVSLQIPARGCRSIHADALFEAFLDLTNAYRFGAPRQDVVVSTLRDHTTREIVATDCYVPVLLPAESVDDIGLGAYVERTGDGYALRLEAKRFAHAVAIDVEGCVPEDNYVPVEPGEPRRIALRSSRDAIPRGRVSALNQRGSTQILAAETIHAG